MTQIIALHGDFATPTMLQRDMGDLSELVDIFFDARKWLRFDAAMGRLTSLVQSLSEPPIVIGYSRGGSAIARLSELVELRAAVVYESPVIDSEGVGGIFPVLQIWNDCGARIKRPGQARVAEEIWSASHPVTHLQGVGRHVKRDPLGHGWDVGLNEQIREWITQKSQLVRHHPA